MPALVSLSLGLLVALPLSIPAVVAIPTAQSAGNLATTSKSQKLANPLNDLLDDAQHNIDKKDFEAAVTPLQKVIVQQPDFAFAHFQLAYVFTALRRTDEARAEYDRVIALDPKMPEA